MSVSSFRSPLLCRLPLLLLLLLLAGTVRPGQAWAADAAAPVSLAASSAAAEPSSEDLHHLLRTLQNPGEREALIRQIQTLIALRAARHPAAAHHAGMGGALVGFLSAQAMRIGANVTALASLAPLTGLLDWGRRIASDPVLRLLWIRGGGLALAVLALALLAGHGLQRLLRRPLRRLRGSAGRVLWLRLSSLIGALLLGWLPAVGLLSCGYAALAIIQATGGLPEPARDFVLAVLNATALVRAVGSAAETLLTPGAVLPLGEETADYWLIWSLRLIRLVVYGWFALGFVFDAGMNGAAHAVLLKAFGLALTGLLIMLILQNRAALAQVIHGPKGRDAGGLGRLRAVLGENWHIVAILYLLGTFGVWAADVPGGFAFLMRATLLSLAVLAAARGLIAAAGGLAARFLAVTPDLEQRLPGLQQRVNLYAPALAVGGRLLVSGVALLLVLQAWGINVFAGLATPAGQRGVGGVVTILLTAALALLLWEAVSLATKMYFSRPGEDGVPVERSARMRTLLPLLRKALAIVLGMGVGLVFLATIGVNIGPLLAGAGIAGIAIGFGAQSLVKDVITGMFVLMQDAVAVGDVVTVAGNSGLVEEISIRSIRLRDQSGTVIIIPFSEVTTVRNMTKDFSYAVFDIGIAYREDVDAVLAVITALAGEIQADADYAWRILEPVEILGLDKFADSAVMVKARLKTKPTQQWAVMREFNRRLKRRFDELNIEMPFPHQTIYFGTDREGKAPPAHIQVDKL